MNEPNSTAMVDAESYSQWELALDKPRTASRRHIRWGMASSACIAVVVCMIFAFGDIPLEPLPQFATFHATFVFIADAVTGMLLLSQFRYRRLVSYLLLACAYLFSSLVTIPFLFSFPGALLGTGGVIGGTQSSIWVWHFWHICFPALVILSLVVRARSGGNKLPREWIVPAVAGALALITILVVAITLAVTVFHDRLPVLIYTDRHPLTPTFYVVGGLAALLSAAALALAFRQARHLSILYVWLAVAMVAFLADVMSSLGSNARYTIGWYGGRLESMIAASILLPVFLGQINLLYQQVAKVMGDLSAANRQLHTLLEEKDQLYSKLQKSEKRVHHMAYHDPLTDLPNRRLLMDYLKHELSQAKRHNRLLALLFLDLDRFKEINDTLGHDVGDELIRKMAGRLGSCVRSGDTVSRIGGDEFVILLPEIDQPKDASLVAEKILELMGEPLSCLGHELKITTSIGIAVYAADDSVEERELLKRADLAMYQAKHSGRNQFRFFEM
ncbi:MAG TPA: GGDEF domain-containing protein [Gallionellaceae bacterium]